MDAPIPSSRSLSPVNLLDQMDGKIRPTHHTPRHDPAYVDWVTDLSCAIVTSERAVVERFSRVARVDVGLASWRRFARNPHGSAICAGHLAGSRMKWRFWRCAACRCPFHAVPGAVCCAGPAPLNPGAGYRASSTSGYDVDELDAQWRAQPAPGRPGLAQPGFMPNGWRRSAAAARRSVPSGRRRRAPAVRVRRRGCGRCGRRSPGPGPIPWRRCGRRRAG